MFRRLILAGFVFIQALGGYPAVAQNPQCPTRPVGDSTNACASTAFVQNQIATIPAGVTSVSNSDGTLTISPTTGAVVAALNLSHQNAWLAVQGFSSGIQVTNGLPWCDVLGKGADRTGASDSHTAFQGCLNTVQSLTPFNGGVIIVPPGSYCDATGTSATQAGVIWQGAGDSTLVSSCASDNTVFTMGALRDAVRDMVLTGKNAVGAAQSIVNLTTGCVECQLYHLRMAFGGVAVLDNGVDTAAYLVTANNTYGPAIWQKGTSGPGENGFYNRLKLDQSMPVCTPSTTTAFVTWTANHSYTGCNWVTTGGFVIVENGNCTSNNGAAPTLTNYSTPISDGTCTWTLGPPVVYDALFCGTACSQMEFTDGDLTFGGRAGINIASTHSAFVIRHSTFANGSYGIWAQIGSNLILEGNTMGGNCVCTVSNAISVFLDSGWTGQVNISNNSIIGNQYGVFDNSTDVLIHGNIIEGSTIAAVNTVAGKGNFTITNNICGSGNAIGVLVAAGGANNYVIAVNNCAGATTQYSDGGTGTNSICDQCSWKSYTPTPTCGTATFSVTSAHYRATGKTIILELDTTITALGTCTNQITFTSPFTAGSGGGLVGRENANSGKGAMCQISSASATVQCAKADISAFGVNDRLIVSGTIEAQ